MSVLVEIMSNRPGDIILDAVVPVSTFSSAQDKGAPGFQKPHGVDFFF